MRSVAPRHTVQKPGPKREHATYVMCGSTASGYLAVVSCVVVTIERAYRTDQTDPYMRHTPNQGGRTAVGTTVS